MWPSAAIWQQFNLIFNISIFIQQGEPVSCKFSMHSWNEDRHNAKWCFLFQSHRCVAPSLSLRSFIESKDIKMQRELSQLGGPQRRHPHCCSYAQTQRQTTIGWSEREWIAIRENIWSLLARVFSSPVLCDKFIKQGKWKRYCDCALIHVSHEHASAAPKEAFSRK